MNLSKILATLTLTATLTAGGLSARGAQDPPPAPDAEPAPEVSAHQTADGSALAGAWRLAKTEGQEKERARAIEAAIRRLPSIAHSRARARLTQRTAPPPTLEIGIEGARFTLSADGGQRVEIELGGEPVKISGRQGSVKMSARMEQETLKVEAQGKRGGRTTTYESDGERLRVETTLRGDRLPQPVTFAATYARSE